MERVKRVPTSAQAGVYSSVTHYLKAVKAAGTTDAAAVMKIMKDTPINDMFAKNGKIREDGRMVHDMYLFEVKKPSESKARWDDLQAARDHPRQRGVPVAGSLALSAGEEMTAKPSFRGDAKRSNPSIPTNSGSDADAPPRNDGSQSTTTKARPMSANEMVLQKLDQACSPSP